MSIEKGREYFRQFGMEDRVQEFEVSSATVELAAQALGVEGARIAKTLSFMVGEQPILILMAGDVKVDNSKYKGFFHTKAKMMSPEQLEEYVGHQIGGVCPFGIKDGVEVYLDESMKRFETVFPAVGSSNSAIELTIPELEKYSNYKEWVDVSKMASATPARLMGLSDRGTLEVGKRADIVVLNKDFYVKNIIFKGEKVK